MKTIRTISIIAVLAAISAFATAQDYPEEYLGLPGDNLNLYAVMNLFQESETLEAFERKLNDQESTINNLDLNGDNLVDYITVSDYVEKNVHTIVLRAALNRSEQQDIAVFIVEKLRNGEVQIQLIGDEALYGPNYIVEPIYAETPNPGYTGRTYRRNVNVVTTTYYDIAGWPMIMYIYHPHYVVWRSSWYWGYYPVYWRPWRPHYWHYYYGYHYHWHDHYYTHYRHWDHYRCRSYNTFYHSRVRVYSPTVVVNINKGQYRETYSRPDQRRSGEEFYARTAANRPGSTVVNVKQQNGSTSTTVGRPGNRQNTYVNPRTTPSRQQNNGTTLQTSGQRTGSQSVRRPTGQERSNATVSRTTTNRTAAQARPQQNRSGSTVTRSNTERTSVQARPQQNRSGSAVTRGNTERTSVQARPQQDRGSSTVARSASQSRGNSNVSKGSSQRSTPAVSRSSSRPSSPSVSRSSSRQSSPSASRSSGSRSSSSQQSKSGSSQKSGSSRR